MLTPADLPNVVQCRERGMGLVFLPGVDGVSRVRRKDWHQAGYIREAVVSDSQQRKFVVSQPENTLAIQFVLLPVLQSPEESVSIGGFQGEERFGRRAEPRHHVDIPIVACDRDKRIEV